MTSLYGSPWTELKFAKSDFNRVRIMLKGLHDPTVRAAEVYKQGHWEEGGYLRGQCIVVTPPNRHLNTNADI